MRIDDGVPHIQAECSQCAMIFDLKFGLDCPRCHGVGVKWARLIHCATCGDTGNVNGEPCEACAHPQRPSQGWGGAPADYPGRLASPHAHTAGEEQDIAELDRMFAMEDTRR
jgi:hypothetical protein